MKIRMLVGGHKAQNYELSYAKRILERESAKGNIIIDEETRQLAKIESLTEDSRVSVFPRIVGG